MSAPSEPLPLAADFPPVTHDEWRQAVGAILARSGVAADADPEAALSSSTYDGITIRPLYTAADAPAGALDALPGHAPFTRGSTASGSTVAGWDVRQRQADTDLKRTNSAVLADLENGATSVWLPLGAGALPVTDLAGALEGVYLDLAPIALDAGADTAAAAAALLALAADRGVDPA